jgi:periplasmic divalent cation tolerance protein
MSEDDKELLLAWITVPTEAAEALARALVTQRLAACVNRITGVQSVYRWDDEVETDTEDLLMIKTSRGRFAALQTAVLALHPYELPEIISVPLGPGLPPYLAWITAQLSDT